MLEHKTWTPTSKITVKILSMNLHPHITAIPGPYASSKNAASYTAFWTTNDNVYVHWNMNLLPIPARQGFLGCWLCTNWLTKFDLNELSQIYLKWLQWFNHSLWNSLIISIVQALTRERTPTRLPNCVHFSNWQRLLLYQDSEPCQGKNLLKTKHRLTFSDMKHWSSDPHTLLMTLIC